MGLFGKEEPEPVEVLGKSLRCQVCGNDGFYKREAQLHTAGMSSTCSRMIRAKAEPNRTAVPTRLPKSGCSFHQNGNESRSATTGGTVAPSVM